MLVDAVKYFCVSLNIFVRTSSILVTVSLHCGILVTKVEVVGEAKSSRVSRMNSGTVMIPGIAPSPHYSRSPNIFTHFVKNIFCVCHCPLRLRLHGPLYMLAVRPSRHH